VLLEAYHSLMVSVAPMPAQQTFMPARSPSYAVRFALLMGPSDHEAEMLLAERWLIWWSLLMSERDSKQFVLSRLVCVALTEYMPRAGKVLDQIHGADRGRIPRINRDGFHVFEASQPS